MEGVRAPRAKRVIESKFEGEEAIHLVLYSDGAEEWMDSERLASIKLIPIASGRERGIYKLFRKRTTDRGEREYFVRWQDYPTIKDSWISQLDYYRIRGDNTKQLKRCCTYKRIMDGFTVYDTASRRSELETFGTYFLPLVQEELSVGWTLRDHPGGMVRNGVKTFFPKAAFEEYLKGYADNVFYGKELQQHKFLKASRLPPVFTGKQNGDDKWYRKHTVCGKLKRSNGSLCDNYELRRVKGPVVVNYNPIHHRIAFSWDYVVAYTSEVSPGWTITLGGNYINPDSSDAEAYGE